VGYCWGRVPDLGLFHEPQQVWPHLTWKTLQPGFRLPIHTFVCGIADSAQVHVDRVYCWGDMAEADLGELPRDMGVSAQRIAVGGTHACYVTRPWLGCWGANDHGQLGTGDRVPSLEPRNLELSYDWVDVATGIEHTCGLTAEGQVYCWGAGYRNQMGDGWQVERLTPTYVDFGVQP
jgi:alpha-tubulin suppressor-like RCC1 family protein